MSIEILRSIKRSVECINIDRIVVGRHIVVRLKVVSTKTSNEVGCDFSERPKIAGKVGRNNARFSGKRSNRALRSDD